MTQKKTPGALDMGGSTGSLEVRLRSETPLVLGETTLPQLSDYRQVSPEALLRLPSRFGKGRALVPAEGRYCAPGLGPTYLTVTTSHPVAFSSNTNVQNFWAAGNSEFAFELEWTRRIRPIVKRLREKGESSSSQWHMVRARNWVIPPTKKTCVTKKWVTCGCKSFPVGGCGQRTCKTCGAARWGRVRRKVLKALRAQKGKRWRFLTMAGPPRSTPEKTLNDLQKAWQRMRAWFWKRWKKGFPFLMVIEVGKENGLIHMHVLAQFPGYICYKEAGREWTRAYPGAVTGGLDFAKRKYKGREMTVFPAEGAAAYVAKYATKGSEILDLPPKLAARTLVTLIGRRMVRASRGFWTKPDGRCKDCGWKYGVAQGAGELRHAERVHKRWLAEHGRRPEKQVREEQRLLRRWEHATSSLEWARGPTDSRVLVEAARTSLDWLAPGHRQGSLTGEGFGTFVRPLGFR